MRLSEAQLAALSELNDICRDRKTEAVIIGAVAFQAFYPNRDRYTRDIDLAVALDFEDFNLMQAELSQKGWKQEDRREHRWHSPNGEVLDIIPAGMQLRQAGQITWPASDMVMSLVGFEHVFKSAIDMPALGTDSRVVPPVVLVLLKVVAFMDDPQGRTKDLSDIRELLTLYEADTDRVFSDAVFAAELGDVDLASAFLLGLDLKLLVSERERLLVEQFLRLISDEAKREFSAFVRAAPLFAARDEDTARKQLAAFSAGFRWSKD
jgi:predicted nucleotidyltransferase